MFRSTSCKNEYMSRFVPRSQWLSMGKATSFFTRTKDSKELYLSDVSGPPEFNNNSSKPFTALAMFRLSTLQSSGKRCHITRIMMGGHPFELPLSSDTVIDFVNELGYPEPVEIVSSIRTNYVYQLWRAILCLLNQANMGRVYSRDPDILLTQRKLMRLNELHKFSDETLTRVMEKLDQMVKDFHLYEYNKGMETREWSEDDKRRSKDFITAIEKRLQIRRIYRSLESFIGGRIRDID
ncbi:hypothetical protein Tco_0609965 [Tanacetum coccineum]